MISINTLTYIFNSATMFISSSLYSRCLSPPEGSFDASLFLFTDWYPTLMRSKNTETVLVPLERPMGLERKLANFFAFFAFAKKFRRKRTYPLVDTEVSYSHYQWMKSRIVQWIISNLKAHQTKRNKIPQQIGVEHDVDRM